MPRRKRVGTGGYVYHVLNRAVGRTTLFRKEGDYAAFERVLQEAQERVPMRLLSYCLMPNHWHLVLWPKRDGELSEYLRWLTVTHTQRYHAAHNTAGHGPLYQGRFKSFPVQTDEHLFTVCRYVERNALRANLCGRAEEWRWGSLWHRGQTESELTLAEWPVPRSRQWVAFVNRAETEAELQSLRQAVVRGAPFGDGAWQKRTAQALELDSTLRPRGRPPKEERSERE